MAVLAAGPGALPAEPARLPSGGRSPPGRGATEGPRRAADSGAGGQSVGVGHMEGGGTRWPATRLSVPQCTLRSGSGGGSDVLWGRLRVRVLPVAGRPHRVPELSAPVSPPAGTCGQGAQVAEDGPLCLAWTRRLPAGSGPCPSPAPLGVPGAGGMGGAPLRSQSPCPGTVTSQQCVPGLGAGQGASGAAAH